MFREHIPLSASMFIAEKHDCNAMTVLVSNGASFSTARSQMHLNSGVQVVQEGSRIPSKFILVMEVDNRGSKHLVTKDTGVVIRKLFPT